MVIQRYSGDEKSWEVGWKTWTQIGPMLLSDNKEENLLLMDTVLSGDYKSVRTC